MPLDQDFKKASEDVKGLPSRPDNSTLLELYSLFKQATDGDATGARPGLLDMKGRAKFDAWTKKKGLKPEDAKTQYVALVKKLQKA